MNAIDLLIDAFDRIRGAVHAAGADLTAEQLALRLDADANSIGWLLWHLTRVQDDHVADVANVEQVWTAEGWVGRFELPFHPRDIGYGHRSSDVAAVRVASPQVLLDYHDAVHAQTLRYLRGLTDADLARVVDEAWDPPVTLGVRLLSVVNDDLQHVGQAAFVRGVAQRR